MGVARIEDFLGAWFGAAVFRLSLAKLLV